MIKTVNQQQNKVTGICLQAFSGHKPYAQGLKQCVCVCIVQERAHKHALQRVLRADAFALEHKRVNDWDLSDAMATFANQYRQELRYKPRHLHICTDRHDHCMGMRASQ